MNTGKTDIRHLLEIAKEAALHAGAAIMEIFNSRTFPGILEGGNFPVTTADKVSHSIILEKLEETGLPVLSEQGIKADFRERRQWNYFWLIDPLDGTEEFIKKSDEFTVNIALGLHNLPVAGVVYAPSPDILYYGSKETGVYKLEKKIQTQLGVPREKPGFHDLLQKEQLIIVVSRSHYTNETMDFVNRFKKFSLIHLGSSLKFMFLVENRADLYPRFGNTMEWDTAAGHAILNALNRGVYHTDLKSELLYNKADLTNPFFVAF